MEFPRSTLISRRNLLRLTTAGAASLAAPRLFASPVTHSTNIYATTLRAWCDGLLAHQISLPDPSLHGALLCPACGLVHGRCADAIYPLLHLAHRSADPKYLRAALALYDWSERNVSRPDGSWINDLTLSPWQGITVFHTIALAESLRHHGNLLTPATRKQWLDRLARAANFLGSFITLETGNINYPITAAHALFLCGDILNEPRHFEKAHALAEAAMSFFTESGLLFGEGHPLRDLTPKGCRPVDLGYNVEESLPALAQYALLADDQPTIARVVSSLQTHMEFMLPNGAWDNSWGTRNYKWSYWGSRTSDGCFPALILLADHDPRFREAAFRNLELMAACTHNGLLYGGPDYFAHGDRPCIHHTFTHAKALATVLDQASPMAPATRLSLPRDTARGLQHFPEIGTYLASIGPWRATVTEYDFEYVERVQAGGSGSSGGGHASGGALSQLYHQSLGQILCASMTDYQLIEISNQQAHLDKPHMCLTPRIQAVAKGNTYTSLTDLEARLTASSNPTTITFDASGNLLSASHQAIPITYQLQYSLTQTAVTITAIANGNLPPAATLQFIVPIIAPATDSFTQPGPHILTIGKPHGTITLRSDSQHPLPALPAQRTFNLVPGLEAIPVLIALNPGIPATITLTFS